MNFKKLIQDSQPVRLRYRTGAVFPFLPLIYGMRKDGRRVVLGLKKTEPGSFVPRLLYANNIVKADPITEEFPPVRRVDHHLTRDFIFFDTHFEPKENGLVVTREGFTKMPVRCK